jgi:hypothetical protein
VEGHAPGRAWPSPGPGAPPVRHLTLQTATSHHHPKKKKKTHTTDPLNNFFDRLWYGKVAYNDGTNPNVTQVRSGGA